MKFITFFIILFAAGSLNAQSLFDRDKANKPAQALKTVKAVKADKKATEDKDNWIHYDMVIAVVNDTPIIESEVLNKLNQEAKLNNLPMNDRSKSRIIDQFIEDALVAEVANTQSIIITNKKVLEYIEKLLRDFLSGKITDKNEFDDSVKKIISRIEKKIEDEPISKDEKLDNLTRQFIEFIEAQRKISFGEFFEDIRSQMRKEQVMSIAIGVTPPSKEETRAWYNSHKRDIGDEFNLKHILIRPRDNSLTEQRAVSKKLNDIRSRILAGESFEALAKQYSQDPISAPKGGDLGWVMLHELDRYFATGVNQLTAPGQISNVVASSYGYHIVKLVGRRSVFNDKMEKLVMMVLYQENMKGQFNKWVTKRRSESDIKIYMQKYNKG